MITLTAAKYFCGWLHSTIVYLDSFFLLIALVWHKGDILVMLTKVKLFKFVMFNSYWSNPPLLYWECHIVDFPKIRQENPCHESRWRIHGICPPYLFSKNIFLIIESEYLFGKGRTSFWIALAYKFVKMRWTETSASIKHHISAWQNVFSSQAVQCLGCAKGDYMNQSDIQIDQNQFYGQLFRVWVRHTKKDYPELFSGSASQLSVKMYYNSWEL